MTYGKEVYVTYGYNHKTKEVNIDQVFEFEKDAQWFCDEQNSMENEIVNPQWSWYYTPKTFFT